MYRQNFLLLSLLFFFSGMAYSQNATLSGTVKGEDKNPIGFVNVTLKGTSLGTTTDADGNYTLNGIAPGSYTVTASFIGYETVEKPVTFKAGETVALDLVLARATRQLGEVVVSGAHDDKSSSYVAKIPMRYVENPQTYNTVPAEIMQQQAVTSFDDALRNVPGISKLWESTGRGGDGSSYYALRGFETQATMINGLPGLTNGSLDPANIERIEVLKGPSSTLFGSSLVSYGGLINTVTKKPYDTFGGEVGYVAGSFGLNRLTADVNTPIGKKRQASVRIVSAAHSENSFQDAGFRRSVFLAPSLSYQPNAKLSFLVNTEIFFDERTNPVMLFLNRSNPLQYTSLEDLNYNPDLSLTTDDISIKNPRFYLQGQMNYKLSKAWTSQTVFSRGMARSDGYYSYLWDTWADKDQFAIYISDQDAATSTTDIQQNFIGDFRLGGIRNRVLVGVDYFSRLSHNNSTGYVWLYDVTPQGAIDYVDPYTGVTVEPRYMSQQSVDKLLADSPRGTSNVQDDTYSAYVSDVIDILPQLLVMGSVRADYFNAFGDISDGDDDFSQFAISPKFGVVFQPVEDKLAIFANYMNGFKNVAPRQVADVDGSNPRIQTFEPEHANQMEFGVKTNLWKDRIMSTISYYDIVLENVVIADPENIYNSLQGGSVQSRGVEADVTLRLFEGFSLIAGYSFNDSRIVDGDSANIWFEEGRRPIHAGPAQTANAWATYKLPKGKLKGFGIAAGAIFSDELYVLDSQVTGRFTLPGYTLVNGSIFYDTEKYRLALNVNNLLDSEYYTGYSTINPQRPLNLAASLHFRF